MLPLRSKTYMLVPSSAKKNLADRQTSTTALFVSSGTAILNTVQNSTYCIAEDILDRGAAPGDRISTSIMAVAFVGRTIFNVPAQVPLTNPLSNAVRRNFNSTNGSPEPNRRLLSVLCLRLSSLVRSHVLNGTTNPSTRCQSFSTFCCIQIRRG